MEIGEWIKELSGSALMLVAVIAMLRFLMGERKERTSQAKACHDTHAHLQEKTEAAIDRNGVVVESNTRMLGRIDQALRQRETSGR